MPKSRGMTGKKHSMETRLKMSLNSGQKGLKSHLWKGNKVGYKALHRWIEGQLGKAKFHICKICKEVRQGTKMEWSNITGIYNRDLVNWQPLCRKCHMKYDSEVLGIKFGRKNKNGTTT